MGPHFATSRLLGLLALAFLAASCASGVGARLTPSVTERSPREIAETAHQLYEYREYGKALREYQRLVERFSSDRAKYETELAWAYYELGFCHLQLKSYRRSQDAFEKVISDFPVLAARTLAEQRLEDMRTQGLIK